MKEPLYAVTVDNNVVSVFETEWDAEEYLRQWYPIYETRLSIIEI